MLIHSAARWIFWPYLLIVLTLTLTPLGGGGGSYDKLEHMLVFFGLTYLALLNWGWGKALSIASGLSSLAGAIELLQGLPLIDRHPDVWDWAADNVGIFSAFAVSALWVFTGRPAR